MPRFKCNNPSCTHHEEELTPHVRFVWNEKTKKLEAEEAVCPVCGEQRDVVKEPGPIEVPWFKPENARNYNNRSIKKYDYDRDTAISTSVKV
jgi:hypothetical protein